MFFNFFDLIEILFMMNASHSFYVNNFFQFSYLYFADLICLQMLLIYFEID